MGSGASREGLWIGGTLEEAAIRETLEETNLQVRLISLLNVYSYPGKAVVVVAYLAEAMAGVPEACDETLEVGLFQYEEIPWEDLAFPSTRGGAKRLPETICPTPAIILFHKDKFFLSIRPRQVRNAVSILMP